jgi:hypothetical protein
VGLVGRTFGWCRRGLARTERLPVRFEWLAPTLSALRGTRLAWYGMIVTSALTVRPNRQHAPDPTDMSLGSSQ